MIANLSIRMKTTLIAGCLLFGMIVLGLTGIRNMQEINANASDLQNHWLPSVRTLGDLRSGLLTYRGLVRQHMLSETAEDKQAAEKNLVAIRERNAELRTQYEKMISSPAERALYQEWLPLMQSYESGIEEVIALSRASVGKVPHEANDLNARKTNPIAMKMDEVFLKSIEVNNKGAAEAGRQADASFTTGILIEAIVFGVCAVFGIGMAVFLVRDVSRGIASIIKPMQALSRGDLSAEVPHHGDKTEMGAMAAALQVFKEALVAKKMADEAAMQEAGVKAERGQRVDHITREFEMAIGDLVGSLSAASSQLEASARTLTATADREQQLTSVVSAASEEASTNVQSVASATEEMTSSINEISRQVQSSARIAGDAVDQASKTNERVGTLSKAASRIGDVVELINTIAAQTNLLALNATIEAARAGEAGRGFAVVASEVKALADQTAKATGEISQHILGIQAATQESVRAIEEISGTIEKLSEISSTIAAAVEEQGAATQEIARNVQQAAQGTLQVSAHINDVQQGAVNTGSASTQVLAAAQSLSGDSARLKIEVGKFLAAVRAA